MFHLNVQDDNDDV